MFTQFRGVLAALAARLDAVGVPCYQLHGDVKGPDRLPTISWWENDRPGVLVVMLQLAMGINLTKSNKAIFLDRLYVPKLNEQAEDRLHRIGADLTQPVQIYNLIANDTIEQRIERILRTKRRLFKSLIEDVAAWKRQLLEELKREHDESA